ncbi:hypothetical protein K2173_020261 [Erythroxylum novogranatense]|uniref:Uncharacterized protein n=1 Tax=Erythroxylum novogranatense TaxID=1862640 RepID=A0AAV8U7I2_9ROSI|nr:hypothetical protein K2173_020261 [Erythroxylum novogranatense]
MMSTASNSVRFLRWNSPIPYLFGGLALMLLCIALALIVLVCSYRRSLSDVEKGGKLVDLPSFDDMEPKIVVIMAGEEQPTYLAKPTCSCQKETSFGSGASTQN